MERVNNPRLLAIIISSLLVTIGSQSVVAQGLRAGAATSNITPDIGADIIGGFNPFPAKHVHDELHARCLVLDDGKKKLAIVVCDLLGIARIVSDEARQLVQQRHGIPPEQVFISATHTHSAISALGQDRFQHDPPIDDYQQFVAKRIADGITRADNNLRPAKIAFGTVEAPEHVFNRRWSMRPGTVPPNPFGGADLVKMNPPAGSPNLVEPAGPTDPTVSFFVLRHQDDRPLAVFTAYSLHYVGGVGGADISADYFGVYCEELKRLFDAEHQDPPFVAMMANGTSGDINNINFRTPRPRQEPYQQIRHVASDVARKVHERIAQLEFRDDVSLDSRYRELDVAWRKPTAEQLAWAEQTLASQKQPGERTDLPYIYAQRTKHLADYPPMAKIPLQVLRIGEVGLGTMPCEVFCEIGLEFKSRSPLQPAFMASLNHGYFGYLPTPRHHDLGGYETWLGTNRLEREASVKMLDALVEMAAEMVPNQ